MRGVSTRKVYVVGVGMSKFMKPQKDFDPDLPDYPEFAKTAVRPNVVIPNGQ